MKLIWSFLAMVVITPGVQSQMQLSTGEGFTCAITHKAPGWVFCWGLNNRGQLGIWSTVTDSSTPKAIRIPKTGLFKPRPSFMDVSAGYQHACALTTEGKLFCWGDNTYKQLGLADVELRRRAAQIQWPLVPSLPKSFLQISAGGTHTCAIAAGKVHSGKVYCWGTGTSGQLGNGESLTSNVPVAVSLPSAATQVSAGWKHTCALTDFGEIYCWGENGDGQLGDGTMTDRNSPVKLDSPHTFISVSAGMANHTCGVAASGHAYCWGSNTFGKLGDGTVGGADRLSPTVVIGVEGLNSVSAGLSHSCAKKAADISPTTAAPGSPTSFIIEQVYCWGSNSLGQVGTGTTSANEPKPILVTVHQKPVGIITFLSAGFDHTCARTNRRTTFCWGNNSSGQIGDGYKESRYQPKRVVGLP